MEYTKIGWHSLKEIKKHPLILVPDLAFFLVFSILTLIFSYTLGIDLSALAKGLLEVNTLHSELLKTFTNLGIVKTIISVAIFLIASFILGSGTLTWKYVIIKRILEKGKFNIYKTFREKDAYFFRLVFIRLYLYIMGVGITAVGAVLISFNIWIRAFVQGTVPMVITSVFVIALFIFYKLAMFFVFPELFFKRKKSYVTLLGSLKKFLRNAAVTFRLWVILFMIGVLYTATYTPLKLFIQKLNTLPDGGILFIIMPTIVTIILFAVSVLFKVWSDLFIFTSYKEL